MSRPTQDQIERAKQRSAEYNLPFDIALDQIGQIDDELAQEEANEARARGLDQILDERGVA